MGTAGNDHGTSRLNSLLKCYKYKVATDKGKHRWRRDAWVGGGYLYEGWFQLGRGPLLNLVQSHVQGGTCIVSHVVDGAVQPQLPVQERRGQRCECGCCIW